MRLRLLFCSFSPQIPNHLNPILHHNAAGPIWGEAIYFICFRVQHNDRPDPAAGCRTGAHPSGMCWWEGNILNRCLSVRQFQAAALCKANLIRIALYGGEINKPSPIPKTRRHSVGLYGDGLWNGVWVHYRNNRFQSRNKLLWNTTIGRFGTILVAASIKRKRIKTSRRLLDILFSFHPPLISSEP